MAQYCIGVDIGAKTIRIGLFHADGNLQGKWEMDNGKKKGCKSILEDIVCSIDKKLKEKNIDKRNVLGIGVSIPGNVNADGVVNYSVNLGWGIVNLKKLLSKLSELPVVVGNNADMAALAEKWKGAAKDYENSVTIILGMSICGGIIVNHKLVLGSNGAGGKIGRMKVCFDETASGYGKWETLERYASGYGIVDAYKHAVLDEHLPTMLDNIEIVTAREIFDATKNGDPLARKIINGFGRGMAHALANLACVVEPQIFIIGGGLSEAGEIVKEYIEKYYEEFADPSCEKANIVLSSMGNDAGIYGAAKYVLESVYGL